METQRQVQEALRRVGEHRQRTLAEICHAYGLFMANQEYINLYTGLIDIGSNQMEKK